MSCVAVGYAAADAAGQNALTLMSASSTLSSQELSSSQSCFGFTASSSQTCFGFTAFLSAPEKLSPLSSPEAVEDMSELRSSHQAPPLHQLPLHQVPPHQAPSYRMAHEPFSSRKRPDEKHAVARRLHPSTSSLGTPRPPLPIPATHQCSDQSPNAVLAPKALARGLRDPGLRDPGLRDPGLRDPGLRDPFMMPQPLPLGHPSSTSRGDPLSFGGGRPSASALMPLRRARRQGNWKHLGGRKHAASAEAAKPLTKPQAALRGGGGVRTSVTPSAQGGGRRYSLDEGAKEVLWLWIKDNLFHPYPQSKVRPLQKTRTRPLQKTRTHVVSHAASAPEAALCMALSRLPEPPWPCVSLSLDTGEGQLGPQLWSLAETARGLLSQLPPPSLAT